MSIKNFFFGNLESKFLSEVRSLAYAFSVAIIIRTFIYQPFVIPSGSMYPTFMVGDFVLGNKMVYGISHQTFPFRIKFFEGRIGGRIPKRGEIVTFFGIRDPEGRDFVKRCVGLPGDKVQVIDGVIHLNGEAVKLKRIEDYTYEDITRGTVAIYKQYEETFKLRDGTTQVHKILMAHDFGDGYYDNTPEYIVPKDHLFMMGDNRHNSSDSRNMENIGFVHKDHIFSRPDFMFFSTEAKWYEPHKWLFTIRPERIFTIVT